MPYKYNYDRGTNNEFEKVNLSQTQNWGVGNLGEVFFIVMKFQKIRYNNQEMLRFGKVECRNITETTDNIDYSFSYPYEKVKSNDRKDGKKEGHQKGINEIDLQEL